MLETFARPLARRTAIWQLAELPSVANDLIDLSAAYLTGDTPPHIGQGAADALDRGETHYVDRLGIKPLRQAIAATMAQDGIPNVTADDLLVTSGAQEALFITLRALVQPHDEVLVADPGYSLVKPLIELGDGIVVPVPSAGEDFVMNAAAYAAGITDKSRFLFVASPNPATGRVLPASEFSGILDLAERHDLTILYDAALSKGIFEPIPDPNFANGIPERVLWISSLSKFYRMGGWRIGWIAGNPTRLKPLRDLKQALSICSASLSQWAAVAALTGPQEWLSEQQAQLVAKRDQALAALQAMGLRVVTPDAAPYLWVDVRSTGMGTQEFVAFARDAGVRVTPGTEFGAAGQGFVRISLAASTAQLNAGLERLSKAMGGRKI